MPQKTAALKFVILLGFVSLCADATYEGARSITGAYLEVLGASGTVVGLVVGFGELIGYGLRLVIGYLSDQTGKYWGITTLGYILNTAVVPLLALTGRWETAAGLMMAERTGKAVRTPPAMRCFPMVPVKLAGVSVLVCMKPWIKQVPLWGLWL